MKWNDEKSTYYDRGRRAYKFGDEIPPEVIEGMGEETVDEYTERGWLIDGAAVQKVTEEKAESQRLKLFEKAKSLGLKPHYRAGVEKLTEMIADHEALVSLQSEAAELGLKDVDRLGFAELTELIADKKAEDEFDSEK